MEQLIARQPILDINKRLYGYELLYRGGPGATLSEVSGERATASLLSSAFLTGDIERISNQRLSFINFTQELLEKKLPLSFPANKIVVEILEDVEPSEKIITVCRLLKNSGYTLALDDFVYHPKFEPLLEIVKIVKIDIRLTPLKTLTRTLNLLKYHPVKLLAERVETLEEFELANRLGFSYFQGYFFSKPERIGIQEITAVKVNLLLLLAEVTKSDTQLERLREIISMDVAVSYKLLRFLNSAYYYLVQEVKSVAHAVALLGEKELRRFIMLVIISELSSDRPDELVRLVLVRAKFCELLGKKAAYSSSQCTELYMMGLFSSLDVMLGSSMLEILTKLPVSGVIKETLMGNDTNYRAHLRLAAAYEKQHVKESRKMQELLALSDGDIQECYLAAIEYSNHLY